MPRKQATRNHAASAEQYQKWSRHQRGTRGASPSLVSQLHGNESLGIRIPHAWRLELWPWGYSPHPRLLESTRLVIGFRHPVPTYSLKNYASWLPEHKHNEYNDLLAKEHESLNKLPLTTTKMKLPSFRQKLTFQLFFSHWDAIGMMLFPFLADS